MGMTVTGRGGGLWWARTSAGRMTGGRAVVVGAQASSVVRASRADQASVSGWYNPVFVQRCPHVRRMWLLTVVADRPCWGAATCVGVRDPATGRRLVARYGAVLLCAVLPSIEGSAHA